MDPLPHLPGLTLTHLLGAGATGRVYAGTLTDTGLPVAVKVIPAPLDGDPNRLHARALQEARFCFSLDHPHVIRVQSYGLAPTGAFFLVMERLAGCTLAERVAQDGPLSPAATLHLARQAASALAAIHSRGALHRDVKPDNLFLARQPGREDRVKLLDFGIVALAEADPERLVRTAAGLICGTPAYMSPEQVRGEPLDARADIYSLGATLFFALTGRLPLDGPSLAAVLRRLADGPPAPDLPDAVPEHLRRLVQQLLAPDRAVRPRDAGILLRALAAADASLSGVGAGGSTTILWQGHTLAVEDLRLPALDSAGDFVRFRLHLAQTMGQLFPRGAPRPLVAALDALQRAEGDHVTALERARVAREKAGHLARALAERWARTSSALGEAQATSTRVEAGEASAAAAGVADALELEAIDRAWAEAWREAKRLQAVRCAHPAGPTRFGELFDDQIHGLLVRMAELHGQREERLVLQRARHAGEHARWGPIQRARRRVLAMEGALLNLEAERESRLVPLEQAARAAEDAATESERSVEQGALNLAAALLVVVARPTRGLSPSVDQ